MELDSITVPQAMFTSEQTSDKHHTTVSCLLQHNTSVYNC